MFDCVARSELISVKEGLLKYKAALLSLLLLALPVRAEEAPDCCRVNILELASELQNNDYAARWEALKKIGLYGSEAGAAVPALVAHLANKEDIYRTVTTLSKIGPPAKSAIPALLALLDKALENEDRYSADATLSINLINALSAIREQRELIVPVLRKALRHPVASIRYEAAHAMGEMGPAARVALPELRKLCSDKDRPPLYAFPYGDSVGVAAQEAIDRISHR